MGGCVPGARLTQCPSLTQSRVKHRTTKVSAAMKGLHFMTGEKQLTIFADE